MKQRTACPPGVAGELHMIEPAMWSKTVFAGRKVLKKRLCGVRFKMSFPDQRRAVTCGLQFVRDTRMIRRQWDAV